MSILKDNQGNELRHLPAKHGDTLIDPRQTFVPIAIVNGEAVVHIADEAGGILEIRGTFVSNFQVEFSVNGIDYVPIAVYNIANEVFISTISTVGVFKFDIPSGATKVRVRNISYTSGTANISLQCGKTQDIQVSKPIPTVNHATITGLSGASVTATITAVTGLFAYITKIRIEKFAVATLTAGTTPILVTTGQLNSRAYSFPFDAQVQGTVQTKEDEPCVPIKSQTVGGGATIVCPATTNVIWRVSVDYYNGN